MPRQTIGYTNITWFLSVYWKRRVILSVVLAAVFATGGSFLMLAPLTYASSFTVKMTVEQLSSAAENLRNLFSPNRPYLADHMQAVTERDTLRHALFLAGQVNTGMKEEEIQTRTETFA